MSNNFLFYSYAYRLAQATLKIMLSEMLHFEESLISLNSLNRYEQLNNKQY